MTLYRNTEPTEKTFKLAAQAHIAMSSHPDEDEMENFSLLVR
jgi:hypothetical protein